MLSDTNAYTHFKLRLGTDFDKILPGRDKSPGELARDYIKLLLEEYIASNGSFDNLVMTIPDTWFREKGNKTAKGHLEQIFKGLGYQNVTLQSEPVAASAYFCWHYQYLNKSKNPDKKPYEGFIVVVDYGGGTLDVTLCKVTNGNSIQVLERYGYGEYNDSNGCAGVAFDESVIRILSCEQGISLAGTDREFIQLCYDFERKKIAQTPKISRCMSDYFLNAFSVDNTRLFAVSSNNNHEWPVYCKHLAAAFKETNEKVLKESLEQMKQRFGVHEVDSNDGKTFKILMVGGFSNFCCVQKCVMDDIFGCEVLMRELDDRFNNFLSHEDEALAVAKGASLIAAGTIRVEQVCTHDIGIIVCQYNVAEDKLEDHYVRIVTRGEKLTDVAKPRYSYYSLARLWGNRGPVRLFIEGGNSKKETIVDKDMIKDLQETDTIGEGYIFGVSVDENLKVSLHVKKPSEVEIMAKTVVDLNNR
ncbi:hypothetical protein FACS1894216_13540 [Synergistales bacterium]|nr:hypothetical protein FACS1894216_13540 [Synergistales bacterium]